jgi:hypothetical protein
MDTVLAGVSVISVSMLLSVTGLYWCNATSPSTGTAPSFMGHESVWPQAVMTACLTGVLAFSMFLILTLNRPYSGAARVTPQPFLLELAHVASRMPK